MTNSNTLKAERLGMPIGTASNRLKKAILLSLLQRLNEDVCFRCSERIEVVEQLSVEHKEAWLNASDPASAFFDLSNIAFSHLSCNSGASSGRGNITHCPAGHGYTTKNTRVNGGKRTCITCHRGTNREWARRQRQRSKKPTSFMLA